jgi:hypothetical protein
MGSSLILRQSSKAMLRFVGRDARIETGEDAYGEETATPAQWPLRQRMFHSFSAW